MFDQGSLQGWILASKSLGEETVSTCFKQWLDSQNRPSAYSWLRTITSSLEILVPDGRTWLWQGKGHRLGGGDEGNTMNHLQLCRSTGWIVLSPDSMQCSRFLHTWPKLGLVPDLESCSMILASRNSGDPGVSSCANEECLCVNI